MHIMGSGMRGAAGDASPNGLRLRFRRRGCAMLLSRDCHARHRRLRRWCPPACRLV